MARTPVAPPATNANVQIWIESDVALHTERRAIRDGVFLSASGLRKYPGMCNLVDVLPCLCPGLNSEQGH